MNEEELRSENEMLMGFIQDLRVHCKDVGFYTE